MPCLRILTDDDVCRLLRSLQQKDIISLHDSLAEALHTYSTGTQEQSACSDNQPERTSVTLEDGSTTLFMPSKAADSTGIKVVTVSAGSSPSASVPPSLKTSSSSACSNTLVSSSTNTSSTTNISSGSANAPSTSTSAASSASIQGSLTLLDGQGAPIGLINASELTAFRTALAATMLLRRREHVHTVTIFGAGKQAYWHIRLALLLRGSDIKQVHIINRTFATAQPMLDAFYGSPDDADADAPWRIHGTHLSILTPAHGEYDRLLKEAVRKADVIFCCTPSTAPLFPAAHLTATEGRKKGRYISAIGSYKPHMCELPPEVLRQAVSTPHHHHHHKHASTAGVVVVDSLTGCLKEAGEIIQAGLSPEQLVEVGELVMLRRQAQAKEHTLAGKKDDGLVEWLRNGNVIYKSVGLALMDLTVGTDLLRLAADSDIGTKIEGF